MKRRGTIKKPRDLNLDKIVIDKVHALDNIAQVIVILEAAGSTIFERVSRPMRPRDVA